MKKQPILQTLTNRSLRQNKGRNLVAVLAIILTAMMFTSLFTLAQGMTQNMTEMYFRQAGTMAHASTKQITRAQIEQIAAHPDVVSYGTTLVVGIAENEELTGRQVEIRYATSQYAKNSFAYPTTGNMPRAENEIALDTLTLKRLAVPAELGQTVTLKWRKGITSDKPLSSTFTLCGFWEGNQSLYASMAWVSEDFAQKSCEGIDTSVPGEICGLLGMSISFADSSRLTEKLTQVLNDCGLNSVVNFSENYAYLPEIKNSIFMECLPMYGGMALVFLAGYLIIFNVFQISVSSDIQFYGKLKTLGASKKQIRKLIYGQGNRLSFIGILFGLVLGYLLGIVLVPVLTASANTAKTVALNPVIFIGSSLFAYITVMTSCLLPARLAGKVSPIEALRYTDADTGIKRKKKKSNKGASFIKMAWANLWRNRKRTILVICSLSLGLVLMTYFYAKNASFDVEKYLIDLTVSDYQIDDATNALTEGYNKESRTISDSLLAEIDALGTVEAKGRLYSNTASLVLSKQAMQNIRSFYTKEKLHEYEAYDPSFPNWKEGFDRALDGEKMTYTVYGADGPVLEAAASENYLLDGSYDAKAFATGKYVLAIGPFISQRTGLPTWTVGEKINLEGREFTVMAVLSPLQPMVQGSQQAGQSAFDLPLILSADAFLQLWPDSNLRKFYFNVADDTIEAAGKLLTDYQHTFAPGMNIVSRKTMAKQYEEQTRSSAVMGYAISLIIALVGMLNFVNSMVTAIISRKHEFAVIQSIGITKRQLCSMLVFEGLYYTLLTLTVSYAAGSFAVGVIVRAAASVGFSTFRFTLFPLVVCTPILILFSFLIPYCCFKNLEKQSVVERLRAAD